jgi:hypothetical protein
MIKLGDIIDVVVGKPGPTSDKKIFEEGQEKFEPKQKFQGDKAYQGGKSIKTPQKKPKNKELASERIFVEHLIRLIKI